MAVSAYFQSKRLAAPGDRSVGLLLDSDEEAVPRPLTRAEEQGGLISEKP